MEILIQNIKGLVQVRNTSPKWVAGKNMADLPVIENAFLHLKNGKIEDFGYMADMPVIDADEVINASGRFVFPSFVDSHTHLVFAASREEEFVYKIKGMSYAEIAAKGGGILNSAKKLQQTTEDELFERAMVRAQEIIRFGTGVVEIKSGYGLTTRDEIKMLRVAKRIGESSPLKVKTTFLGAHAIPKEYSDRNDYIKLIKEEMIPAIAEEGLADYIDAFCEKGFFTPEETEDIMEHGKKFGMKPKIHANQLHISGGVQVGVKTGAVSVDHLEAMGEEEIKALQGTHVMPTLLPGAAFFLGTSYPPARDMLNAGLPLALATDYNPGSAPCGNMPLMLSLACIKMKMTPEEAINAATINTAYALELQGEYGSITKGKVANVFITNEMPSYAFMPYAFGSNLVHTTILNGEIINKGLFDAV
ncbi:imidazolonepropionase [Fulvivirga kasyanovii]|uniref:Imidazolonepropionase n=1 Tax=Fulvivirga kasyanovii TaxID=396812 RepID=A0ABW9RRI9_9BACT|nr:imidazolonepropionase [Fulvivirga kasyanovii]MTI26804.1 imidazolonepropionase [Fulvivirga kasyanovii]